MTHNRLDSRGIQPVKLHADRYRLTTWHTSSERESGEIGQDINLGSDAGLHYKHRDNEVEDEVPITVASPGFVQRLLSFMSKTPLVMRSSLAQSTASYGAVPEDDFSLSEDTSETGLDVTDDVRRRDRRKGKESVLRHIRNARTSSSGPRSDRNSSSRNRRGGALPHADAAFATGAGYSDGNDGKLFESSVPRISSETGSSREGSDSEEDLIDIDRDSSKTSEDPIDNSLYAQVRASVPTVDNISLSISTPRMWILSLSFAFLGSAASLFFSLRFPSVAISPIISLILVHPLGLAWDVLFKRDDDPDEDFVDGVLMEGSTVGRLSAVGMSRGKRLRLWLAQGRWNEKEHVCVFVSSSVSFGFAFATDVIVEQSMFYHQRNLSITYQLLLTISSQILGYGFAGLTRRYLVQPPSMIWPGTLASTAMFATLHKSENRIANGWRISRWRFFLYVWTGAFAWYFIPGLLMPALSYFSVVTWLAPENVVVANLFGVSSGLGLFPLTFDWAQIAYIGSPLLTPFWAAANVAGGLILVMWIVAPIMYYRNDLYSSFMPILSSAVFDDTGNVYNVSRILTSDFLFDREAYENYSRVYLPIAYVLSYALQFAALSALITHTACFHGRQIWHQTRRSFTGGTDSNKTEYGPAGQTDSDLFDNTASQSSTNNSTTKEPRFDNSKEDEDVHNRLMRHYEDAPMSWYLVTLLVCLGVGMFVVAFYPQTQLPPYGLLLALSITGILFIPVGIVMAITNQQSSLYLISQLTAGYIWPGKGVANMIFVTYCYISSAQGVKFSSDLKLGHYMKIPPKILFKVQIAATLVSCVTQVGVLNWMFGHLPGICTPQAINSFTCPIAKVHFNGSLLFGVVGPRHFFGTGALYRQLIWAFLIGAVGPPLVWLMARRSTTNLWRKVNLPVMFGSLSWIPPATGLNFSVWALVCYIFNFVIRRRAPAWWGKYTMTMSAALDSGLAFSLLVIFFLFIFPQWNWIENFHYWGTDVYKQGCDWKACSYRSVAPGEHFGPGPPRS